MTPTAIVLLVFAVLWCFVALWVVTRTQNSTADPERVQQTLLSRKLSFNQWMVDDDKSLSSLDNKLKVVEGTARDEVHESETLLKKVSSLLNLPDGVVTLAGIPHLPLGNSEKPRFLKNGRCGSQTDPKVGCDPHGEWPCCSNIGWCGSSEEHCGCEGCVDYRVKAVEPVVVVEEEVAAPGLPASFSRPEGDSIVVIVPFRDRETHLVKFKQFWRRFVAEGQPDGQVFNWEIFVIEQFDATPFNRGWNFNVGFAIATGQTSASIDMEKSSAVSVHCAVIQDIDYLPDNGVDYGQCDVPIQLSAEIDRFDWKTPYLASAGGIVGATPQHWRQINGFSNEYSGWGGEDDDLYHRLRLNNLLHGDCYPFCSSKDSRIGKTGISIKRPPKGHGVFRGEHMHSANHTKRITDSNAYNRNLQLLKEIQAGGSRWKTDGLENLRFRIVSQEIDTTDSVSHRITHHHYKVRKGEDNFDWKEIRVAAPPSFCISSSVPSARTSGLSVKTLREVKGAFPLTVLALQRTFSSMMSTEPNCAGVVPQSFLLVDTQTYFAKILPDNRANLLVTFYRSLATPSDGLVIADRRSPEKLRQDIVGAGALLAFPTSFTVCHASGGELGTKYSIQFSIGCSSSGWDALHGGTFLAEASPKNGLQPFVACDERRWWTQIIKKGTTCEGSNMELSTRFWAVSGGEYCVGTSQATASRPAFSRVLRQSNCGGDGFTHDFTFGGVSERHSAVESVCIGRKDGVARLSKQCDKFDAQLLARFPAVSLGAAAKSDSLFCVERKSTGDVLRAAGTCTSEKFSFAVPESTTGITVCSGTLEKRPTTHVVGVGTECGSTVVPDLVFTVPDVAAVVASLPPEGPRESDGVPLFTLVDEVPCFSFVCPHKDSTSKQ